MFSTSGGLRFCLDEHFQMLWESIQILWLLAPMGIYHCILITVNWIGFYFRLETPQRKWVQLCLFGLTAIGTLQSTWLLSASRHRRYFMLWLHRLLYHATFSLRHMFRTRWFPCPTSALKCSVTGEHVSCTPPEWDIYPAKEHPMRCPLDCFFPTSEFFKAPSSFPCFFSF